MPEENTHEPVELPTELVKRIEARVSRTEFESSGDYIKFVLEEVLYRIDQAEDGGEFDAVDEGEVINRLEALGYLRE